MIHEHRMRIFATMMMWLLRKYREETMSQEVFDSLEKLGSAILEGEKDALRALWKDTQDAMTICSRNAIRREETYDVYRRATNTLGSTMVALLRAIEADKELSADAPGLSTYGPKLQNTLAQHVVEDSHYEAGKACKSAILVGIPIEAIEPFKALIPSWAFRETSDDI